MGFSSQQYRKEQQERRWKINPAWRGIGCILFLIIPVMAWVGAGMVLPSLGNLPVFGEMKQLVLIPYTRIQQIDAIIFPINHYFASIGFSSGQLFLTILFLFIGYGLMALLYAILYKVAGPPRYGPFDIPPDAMKR